MVFHMPIHGLVAHPKHIGSRGRVWACDWSRGTDTGKGSRDESCVTFPGSHACFSGSHGGIFVFTIWL